MPDKNELIKSLNRWAEIAEHVHEKGKWNECSLLHAFSDKLAREIREAVKLIEQTPEPENTADWTGWLGRFMKRFW